MITEILSKAIIGIISSLIIITVVLSVLYFGFKLLIIPYMLDKIPIFLKDLLR